MLTVLDNAAGRSQYMRADGVLPTRPPALTDNAVRCDVADGADSAFVRDDASGERWLPVPGFESGYEVSDLGRVRSVDREVEVPSRWGGTKVNRLKGRLLKPSRKHSGHLFVALGKANYHFVHRLVLTSFDRPPNEGEECRHLDGDPNNNRLDNLRWGTRSENIADRKRLGEENPSKGEGHYRATMSEKDVRLIRQLRQQGLSFGKIAKEIGVSRGAVAKVLSGHTWGWLK